MSEFLKTDVWLSKILERDVYKLIVDESSIDGDRFVECEGFAALKSARAFAYAKTAVDFMSGIRSLTRMGFTLVDTNVLFSKPIGQPDCAPGKYEIQPAIAAHEDQVAAVAFSSFEFSRFHLDPLIPNELANRVKAEWTRSYFRGQRGDQMTVATLDGVVAGFVMLIDCDDGTRTIDLIAVDRRHRGRGVARGMISHVEAHSEGFTRIRVGTQLANIPSIRLYARLGFVMDEAHYVFHHHQAEGCRP
ncbi:MAG: GNAT family N-acetyltransferase [Planctomycetes bacterium]|nr:GNAT family N-acetyltransferase [Planctomycetota bacterium]